MKTTSCSITRFTRHMCAPPLRRPCRLAYRQLIISRLSFSICYLRLAIAWQLFAICSLRFAVGHPAASAHSTSQTPSVQKVFKGIFKYTTIMLPPFPNLQLSTFNLQPRSPNLRTFSNLLHAQVTRSHVQSHLTFLKGQPHACQCATLMAHSNSNLCHHGTMAHFSLFCFYCTVISLSTNYEFFISLASSVL